jgi:hypothetical protein
MINAEVCLPFQRSQMVLISAMIISSREFTIAMTPTSNPFLFPLAKPLKPSPTCYCVSLCDSCKGNGLADCHTICEYAALSNNECISMCNTALHDVGNP